MSPGSEWLDACVQSYVPRGFTVSDTTALRRGSSRRKADDGRRLRSTGFVKDVMGTFIAFTFVPPLHPLLELCTVWWHSLVCRSLLIPSQDDLLSAVDDFGTHHFEAVEDVACAPQPLLFARKL